MKRILTLLFMSLLLVSFALAEDNVLGNDNVASDEVTPQLYEDVAPVRGALDDEVVPPRRNNNEMDSNIPKEMPPPKEIMDARESLNITNDMARVQDRLRNMSENMDGTGSQIRERMAQGLQVALSNVQNENARMRLEQNLARFEERMKLRLENMRKVEVESIDEETGAVRVRAKESVRFFGFIKGTATKRFEVAEDGTINERAPWYSIFYSEDKNLEDENQEE
jgi:hypothetical protein